MHAWESLLLGVKFRAHAQRGCDTSAERRGTSSLFKLARRPGTLMPGKQRELWAGARPASSAGSGAAAPKPRPGPHEAIPYVIDACDWRQPGLCVKITHTGDDL